MHTNFQVNSKREKLTLKNMPFLRVTLAFFNISLRAVRDCIDYFNVTISSNKKRKWSVCVDEERILDVSESENDTHTIASY